ncbi:hypothetical protein [Nitrolancea hollandica]|uniref:hypothetical protein n=1 Tax=Nitrolancea hollandica TaxID=1206749 RepID=UPI00126780B1|nr:hypothetical protein [Nitrolancea hollandica]
MSEDGNGQVIETWNDQTTGDVLKKTTDKNGKLREVILRRGLTISTYVVTDRNTGVDVRQVLSKDDLVLTAATAHLDQFRWSSEGGAVTNLGQEIFNGQPAIKAKISRGEWTGMIAYLAPDTLYPVGYLEPDGTTYTVTYRTVETLPHAKLPASVTQYTLPPAEFNDVYQRLSPTDLAQFTAYPVVNLGPAFGDYTLDLVERYQSQNKGHDADDRTYSIYRMRDANGTVTGEIQVNVRKPLTDEERAGNAKAEQAGAILAAEPVTINGESVRVRPDKGGGMWLEIERPDSYIYLLAPDRDTALTAGAALQPASAAPETK